MLHFVLPQETDSIASALRRTTQQVGLEVDTRVGGRRVSRVGKRREGKGRREEGREENNGGAKACTVCNCHYLARVLLQQ